MLRVRDLHAAEPRYLGSFDYDRVQALSAGVSFKDMDNLLPPEQRATLADPDGQISRDSSELENDSGLFCIVLGSEVSFL